MVELRWIAVFTDGVCRAGRNLPVKFAGQKKRRLWAPFSSSLPYYFILAAISSSFFAEPGCYFEGANRLFPEAGD
jgi:hypothetical protein